MDLLSEDVWRAVLSQLDSRSICSLSQANRSGWRASCYASVLDVQLRHDFQLEQRTASLVEYVTNRVRRNLQVRTMLRPACVLLQMLAWRHLEQQTCL